MNMTPQFTPGPAPETTISGRFFQYRAVIFLMLFAVVIWLNFTFIKPLLMGAIFAAVLYPLMGKFDKWKRTKKLSETLRATIITVGFTLIVLVPIGLLLWVVAESALEKAQGLHLTDLSKGSFSANSIIDSFGLRPIIDRISEVAPVNEAQLKQYATKGAASVGAFVIKFLQGLFTSIPGIIFSNIVIIFTLFFMLIDGPKAVHFLRHNSIFNVEQTDKLIHSTQLLCNSVIVATVISGAVQAAIV
ncbi:MAG: AI-2E family transporter, partial [Proteobacteria bacterium]